MEDKEVLKEAKTIFNSLKTDLNSVSFSEEKIDMRLLEKTKKIEMLKGLSGTETSTFSW